MFKARGYPEEITNYTIQTHKERKDTPYWWQFEIVTTYNAEVQPILPFLTKHWDTITNDTKSILLHNLRPSICFKVNRSLGQQLVKVRVRGLDLWPRSDLITFALPSFPAIQRVRKCNSGRCPLWINIFDVQKLGNHTLKDQVSCNTTHTVYAVRCN